MDILRHDLVRLAPPAWRRLLAERPELAREPLALLWQRHDWPLVARRYAPGDAGGLALGWPLPLSAGKRRIAIEALRSDIAGVERALPLASAIGAAPGPWRATLQRLLWMAAARSIEARVFGSLAWQAMTGLDYLSRGSDLDLLLALRADSDVAGLLRELATIEAAAPMRIDGELLRCDGAGVNWRELRAGCAQVLAKSVGAVELVDTSRFVEGVVP